MNGTALLLALCAAVLHAVWNAIIKASGDRTLALAAVSAANVLLGAAIVLVAPPPARAAWPFIAGSACLHAFYYVFLTFAYRFGDLSEVYPIARGAAPALVAAAAYLAVGEALSAPAIAGLATVSGGIILLSVGRRDRRPDGRALASALATGAVIAAYSVTDGIGVRHAGSPFGYIGWLLFLELPIVIAIAARRIGKPSSGSFRVVLRGSVAGVLSVFAYGGVIYANGLAPLGAVSAVRESSVIMAALIGTVVFGERPWRLRLGSAAIVAAGVLLLASAGPSAN